MIDSIIQVPTLYLIAIIGITCGILALLLSLLAFAIARKNNRMLKSLCKNVETILTKKEAAKADKEQVKATLTQALRELEHDHDRIKDYLNGLAGALKRIESVARQVVANQSEYIKNNVGSSNNKIKVNAGKAPDSYPSDMIHTLLTQIIDRMQHSGNGQKNKDDT